MEVKEQLWGLVAAVYILKTASGYDVNASSRVCLHQIAVHSYCVG